MINTNTQKDRSVAVVGGGFGGVGAAVMLKQQGYESVTVFERDERLGGVWRRNTYPGAACDVPSHLYEFSFAPNPDWGRRYATQPEIQQYLEDVATRFGVRSWIRTGTEVLSATWDSARSLWRLHTNHGSHEAEVLIAACGQLTTPKTPSIPGAAQFNGGAWHTADWRHDVDLAGKRVAVVGTGASAIQVVPAVQASVAALDVYQRSPGWTLPKDDFIYPPWAKRLFARMPAIQRLERGLLQAFMNLGAVAMTRHHWLAPPFRALARKQIEKAISDPALRRKVTPVDEFGCKRIMLTDTWYPALSEPNVTLIDEPIESITPAGIRTSQGVERPADVIVWATGFRAHDFVAPMAIEGRDGRSLAQEWSAGARAYLGLTVPEFPNMFLLYGPNTNGGTGSVVVTLECGMNHVLAALEAMDASGAGEIELHRPASERFDRELRSALTGTVWHSGCRNWYVDESGHDPNQWPWSWRVYAKRTSRLEPGTYSLRTGTAAPGDDAANGSVVAAAVLPPVNEVADADRHLEA